MKAQQLMQNSELFLEGSYRPENIKSLIAVNFEEAI